MPSDRKFGALFTVVFALLTAYFVYKEAITEAEVCGIVSVIFLAAALVWPSALSPLNKAWMKFALVLGTVMSFVVLSIIFFTVITPIAVVLRMTGRDELRLKLPDAQSFWLQRDGVLEPSSFRNQY